MEHRISENVVFLRKEDKKNDSLLITLKVGNDYQAEINLTGVTEGNKKGVEWMTWLKRDTEKRLLKDFLKDPEGQDIYILEVEKALKDNYRKLKKPRDCSKN